MSHDDLWYRCIIPTYRWKKLNKFIRTHILQSTLDITYEDLIITMGNLSLQKIEANRIFTEAELLHQLLLDCEERKKISQNLIKMK